jgi:uncharacterized protein YndB with AHSA1/START domain
MDLKFEVQVKIQKPRSEVFDAVYNPKKLSAYFTTGGASAPLKEGTTVTWDFADFPGAFPVYVKKVVPGERIVFEWAVAEHVEPLEKGMPPVKKEYNTRVEISFESLDANSTLVKISESGWKETPEGLKSSYGNCSGWMHMSLCLKAYLEYGINLRKGSF